MALLLGRPWMVVSSPGGLCTVLGIIYVSMYIKCICPGIELRLLVQCRLLILNMAGWCIVDIEAQSPLDGKRFK